MKKKLLAVLLAAVMLLTLTACGGKKTTAPSAPAQSEPTYDEPFPNNELSEPDEQAPEADGVCYLPVSVVSYTDIPPEAEERLGTGSFEETVASYEYDEAGRLLRYHTSTNDLTFQYLDEIALPAVLKADVWESGEWEEMLAFKDPRWSADRSEIWLDVAYSDAFKETIYDTEQTYVTADICLSDLQLDEAGRLAAATLTWDTVFDDDEIWGLAGYTFDEHGNLLFVPDDGWEFTYQYDGDGHIVEAAYDLAPEVAQGQSFPTTVKVGQDAIRVEANIGASYDFADMGDGRYRSGDEDDWNELVFDEDGKLIRSAWHAGISGITYSYTVEYMAVPRAQYVGTPVDYTNIVPVLMYEALYDAESQAEVTGKLQLPVTAQILNAFFTL